MPANIAGMIGRDFGAMWEQNRARTPFRRALRMSAVCAALAFGAVCSSVAPAAACTLAAPPPALLGYPGDGDAEVPTDVVPFYRSQYLYPVDLTGATFSLASSTGDMLTVEASIVHSSMVDLRLEKTLQPNTTYTLTAIAKVPRSSDTDLVDKTLTVTFTTGAGPVAAVPDPPQALLQHYQFAQPPTSSCSPSQKGTCVAVSTGLPVEVIETTADGTESTRLFAPLYIEPRFTELATDSCLELRTRAPNATYSSPLVLCASDAPVFTISGSENIACTAQGITQDGAQLPTSAGVVNGWAGEPGYGGAPDEQPGYAGGPASEPEVSAGSGGSSAGGASHVMGSTAGQAAVSVPSSIAGSGGATNGLDGAAPAVRAPVESAGCSYAASSGSTTNSALATLCALGLFARLRRSRRVHAG